MKKNGAAKTGKTPLFIKLVIVVVCAVSIFSTVQIELSISQRQQELNALNAQIADQSLKNRGISQMIDSADNGYMERMAREKWGYVYPQERVYVDVSGS